jgi:hypothetical protein
MSDFADTVEDSPYVGARLEVQDVNALGQAATLSFLVEGGFAILRTDAELKAVLAALGDTDDGSYFDIGVGVRAHSTAVPLFLGAGVAYVNLDDPGSPGSNGGFGAYVGLGFTFGPESFRFEIEGRANAGFINDRKNIQFLQALVGFGFPL